MSLTLRGKCLLLNIRTSGFGQFRLIEDPGRKETPNRTHPNPHPCTSRRACRTPDARPPTKQQRRTPRRGTQHCCTAAPVAHACVCSVHALLFHFIFSEKKRGISKRKKASEKKRRASTKEQGHQTKGRKKNGGKHKKEGGGGPTESTTTHTHSAHSAHTGNKHQVATDTAH